MEKVDDSGIKIIKAILADAEKIAKLYDEVYSCQYPLKEFTNPSSIESIIKENKYIWYVAKDKDDIIIGSGVGIPEEWNESFEMGRMVIRKDFRRSGICQDIHRKIAADERLDKFVIEWYDMRQDIGLKIAKNHGTILAGFLPGKHDVNYRELHAFFMKIRKDCALVKPPQGYMAGVFEGTNLEHSSSGDYPSEVFVGPERDEELRGVLYQRLIGDNAIIINGVHDDNLGLLVDNITNKPIFFNADYIELKVLADKVDKIKELTKQGFFPWVYLFGWYEKDGKRYDCVLLAKSEQSTQFVEQALRIGPKMRARLCEHQNTLARYLKELKNGI